MMCSLCHVILLNRRGGRDGIIGKMNQIYRKTFIFNLNASIRPVLCGLVFIRSYAGVEIWPW